MTKLLLSTAGQMEAILFNIGFQKIRQRGSHIFYRHPDGRTTTVPHHANRQLARPLIREILREIEITPDEYQRLLLNS